MTKMLLMCMPSERAIARFYSIWKSALKTVDPVFKSWSTDKLSCRATFKGLIPLRRDLHLSEYSVTGTDEYNTTLHVYIQKSSFEKVETHPTDRIENS